MKSPMYSGVIKSMGARYCPSIEDKITKFPDKNNHQIFLRTRRFESDLIYPNGISSSLPEDVQEMFVRSIKVWKKLLLRNQHMRLSMIMLIQENYTHP